MQSIAHNLGRRAALLAALAAVLGAALLAIALGGGSLASASDLATASGSKTVTIKNFAYGPSTLHISPGTRVVWVNSDSVTHTATSAGSFTTGKIKPGHAAAVRFGSRGTYRYHCTIHPTMRGKIVVR